jgi:hypothetical protein
VRFHRHLTSCQYNKFPLFLQCSSNRLRRVAASVQQDRRWRLSIIRHWDFVIDSSFWFLNSSFSCRMGLWPAFISLAGRGLTPCVLLFLYSTFLQFDVESAIGGLNVGRWALGVQLFLHSLLSFSQLIYLIPNSNFLIRHCIKKPPCRGQGGFLAVRVIYPIHAEPVHSQ